MPVRRSFATVLSQPLGAGGPRAASRCEGLILVGLLTFLPLILQIQPATARPSPGLVTGGLRRGGARLRPGRPHGSPVRVRAGALVGVGATAGTLGYVVARCWTTAPSGVLVAAPCLGVAWAFMHTTMQTWVTDVVPEARAAAVSLFASLLFTGGAIGSARRG